jgi:hypothetical protein
MRRFFREVKEGALGYCRWLSKQTVGFLNALFFLTMAGKVGGIVGTILIMTIVFTGSYFMAQDDYAELHILNAISSSDAMIIHKETGEVLAQ